MVEEASNTGDTTFTAGETAILVAIMSKLPSVTDRNLH